MKHPSKIATEAVSSVGMKHVHLHNLQFSSLDTMHTWITHSIHESAEAAKKMWKDALPRFPKYYKWRIQKTKLVPR